MNFLEVTALNLTCGRKNHCLTAPWQPLWNELWVSGPFLVAWVHLSTAILELLSERECQTERSMNKWRQSCSIHSSRRFSHSHLQAPWVKGHSESFHWRKHCARQCRRALLSLAQRHQFTKQKPEWFVVKRNGLPTRYQRGSDPSGKDRYTHTVYILMTEEKLLILTELEAM